ncbi:unnamed protein product [Rangifer tarandus platyrhynchus]|uniref:Uncharacterized protein n=1 Tax=Rangifer tarandus platyrhynchus TaxID=3082113 RepID=A0ABN8ZIP0_RANTA|nr:unnamed protein product [Rangifer tarandus platyrhynchus]
MGAQGAREGRARAGCQIAAARLPCVLCRTPLPRPRAPPPSLLRSPLGRPASLPRPPPSAPPQASATPAPADPPAASPQPPHPCTCSALPQTSHPWALLPGRWEERPVLDPEREGRGLGGRGWQPPGEGGSGWRQGGAAFPTEHFVMAKPGRESPSPETLQTPLQQARCAGSETY